MNENKNFKAIIIILILAAVGFGAWLWYSQKEVSPEAAPQAGIIEEGEPAGTGDTITEIEQDLEAIDMGDLDKEFEEIDMDLQNL